MNRILVLLVATNIVVIVFGGLIAYSDLHMRNYEFRSHANTRVIDVEYGLLVYRPTYEYYDIRPEVIRVSTGSWTVDFLQLTILIMAITDVSWLYFKRKKIEQTAALV